MNPMTWLCDVTEHKQSRHRRESASKQWLMNSEMFQYSLTVSKRTFKVNTFRQGHVKVSLCFIKPVIQLKGLNLNALQ